MFFWQRRRFLRRAPYDPVLNCSRLFGDKLREISVGQVWDKFGSSNRILRRQCAFFRCLRLALQNSLCLKGSPSDDDFSVRVSAVCLCLLP